MLYYYFHSKEQLFDAVLAAAFRERAGGLVMTEDPVSNLVEWYQRVSQAPDLCRLLQWESLERMRAAALPDARSMADGLKTVVRKAQGRNGVSTEFEPEFAALALVAVTVFPVAFPRLAELLTGIAPRTPLFGQKHAGLLRTLLREEPRARR
jgi:AcrR family transcriptional regulator